MTKQEIIIIEYSADKRGDKAFKPEVYEDGKWIYTISECKKTERGALNSAKKMAEQYAETCPNDAYCKTVVQQKA